MEEAVVKRVMPHSIEAEQAVIGSMMMNEDAIIDASEIITADDFYGSQYGILFQAMVDLNIEGKAADLVTIKDKLVERGVPDEVVSTEFIRDILMSVPTSANIKQYAEIVYEKSILRQLIKTMEGLTNTCYAGNEKLEVILEDAEKQMFSVFQNRMATEYTPIRQIVLEALNKIDIASKNHGSITGIRTGFNDLDYLLSGLQNSDLILIAARPSMGKTAFALNIAEYIAVRQNIPAVLFSVEMSKEQLINRLLAQDAMINSQSIRTGKMADSEWSKLVESADNISNSGLIIDDTPAITISEIRSKCRKYKLEKDIKVILVDYLQIIRTNGRYDSRQQEISEISRTLKAIARELDVPVIALSQLSRAVEARNTNGNRPMLSDLRESGAIEQDADVVMFLYREDYYNKDTERKNISEVIVAKHRNGPIGTIELSWLPDYTKFANM